MKSLEYGMSHSIYQVGSSAFEAIATLGFYSWFEDTKSGGASSVGFLGGYLDGFLEKSFRYVLFEDFDSQLAGHAGDALFALVMARQVGGFS
jgi:hypothetical protein